MKRILIFAVVSLLTIIGNAQTAYLGKDFANIKGIFLGEGDIKTIDYGKSIHYSVWNTDNGSFTFKIDKQTNKCYEFIFWPSGGDTGRKDYLRSLNEKLGLSNDGAWLATHPDDGRLVEIQYSVMMGLGGQFSFSYKH